MVHMKDYEKPDGSLDWGAYRKAQIAEGEVCYQCGTYIFLGAQGSQRLCSACKRLVTSSEKEEHPLLVRCPDCGHRESAEEAVHGFRGYDEEECSVYCGVCGNEYTVIVHVNYEFESPARKEDEDEEVEADSQAS